MEQFKEKIEKLEKETEKLKGVLAQFPDAVFVSDRWGKERISSPSVNDKVTDCDINHSCGCCNDAPLYAYPYLDTGHGRIYSMPEKFTIGQANPYTRCDHESKGWKEKMRNSMIAEVVIEKIENYFLKEKEKIAEFEEEEFRSAKENDND